MWRDYSQVYAYLVFLFFNQLWFILVQQKTAFQTRKAVCVSINAAANAALQT